MIDEFDKQIKRGMLDVIILNMLMKKSYYGYELLLEIRSCSTIFKSLKEGTLYPRLYKLSYRHYLTCQRELSDDKSRLKKVYSITEDGRNQLEQLLNIWDHFIEDMTRILERGN